MLSHWHSLLASPYTPSCHWLPITDHSSSTHLTQTGYPNLGIGWLESYNTNLWPNSLTCRTTCKSYIPLEIGNWFLVLYAPSMDLVELAVQYSLCRYTDLARLVSDFSPPHLSVNRVQNTSAPRRRRPFEIHGYLGRIADSESEMHTFENNEAFGGTFVFAQISRKHMSILQSKLTKFILSLQYRSNM